jgi:hypothetical protein
MRIGIALLPALAAAAVVAGCGDVERSGAVGDRLEGGGLEVTLQKLDREVPTPDSDVTGLSVPGPGMRLVGARVRVCSDHGGAIGQFSFGMETDRGDGRLKYSASNYDRPFETVRDGCGGGWLVFEIPKRSTPTRLEFGFEDTGTARQPQTQVDARFSWKLDG